MYPNQMEETNYAAAEAAHCIETRQCYCHVTMASLHGAAPCHFCVEEVNADLWEFGQEADEQEALQAQLDALGPLGATDIERLQPAWNQLNERKAS